MNKVHTYPKAAFSKAVGWDTRSIEVPTVERTQELIKLAKDGDKRAAMQVFVLYRFLPTYCDSRISNLVAKAFKELFK